MGQMTIEYLCPANHVEMINGLIYIQGGGWTDVHRTITAAGQPSTPMGIVVALAAPWSEIGIPHIVTVQIHAVGESSADSGQESETAPVEPVLNIEARVILSHQVTARPRSEQRINLGLQAVVQFPAAGAYRLTAKIDGEASGKPWTFRVHDLQAQGG